jgi:hypothetical protein
MYYKEFLRVRRCFIGFAVGIVAIAFLITIFSGHVSGSLSQAPGASHAVVAAAGASDTNHLPQVGVEVQGDSDKLPIEILFAIAGFIAAIFGMVLGCVFAAENSGHLEIAWTRPASRIAYGLGMVLVDWVGMLAMFAFVCAIGASLITVHSWWSHVTTDSATAAIGARMLAFPFAWFGLVAALTASLRGGSGLVAGLSWPVASVSVALEKFHAHSFLTTVLTVINYVNPLIYVSFTDTESRSASSVQALVSGQIAGLGGLLLIALAGVAVALVQWRRLEA